ncbi:MAG: hypothetical protein A2Z88_03160 [Omnitrophica WOR_2 bacterium GWA2_47_8]|nr:MAG: hypothetical protein A2Z88_03160 [Omnitrophica WOR_2 bacterium GWA2_47_8]
MLLRKELNWVIAIGVFLSLLVLGFSLARNKPLWNDEVFTQTATIDQISYADLITEGPAAGESNACPLFYAIQKIISDIGRYKTPTDWVNNNWDARDVHSQIFLRIQPVVFMALAIAVMFYYFSRQYSLWAGLYSLAASLSSYMFWLYWAEARPYALWVFLTVLQSVLFLEIIRQKKADPQKWRWLTLIHILLALTTILSLGQIVIVSFLLWLYKEKAFKAYIFLTVLPTCVTLFYSLKVGSRGFYVDGDWSDFIIPCVPWDRLSVIALYGLLLVALAFLGKSRILSLKENIHSDGKAFFVYAVLIILSGLVLLGLFQIREVPGQGNPISIRYFIYLTPVTIMAATLSVVYLLKTVKPYRWLFLNLLSGVIGITLFGFFHNCFWVIKLCQ